MSETRFSAVVALLTLTLRQTYGQPGGIGKLTDHVYNLQRGETKIYAF